MFKYLCISMAATCLSMMIPDAAVAKDKGKPAHAQSGSGKKVKLDKPGKGPKAIPPGQIKRYTRGAKLPADTVWEEIGDLSRWDLPPPGRGNKYIRVDNEILEIAGDTQTVIDAVGIVGDLLK